MREDQFRPDPRGRLGDLRGRPAARLPGRPVGGPSRRGGGAGDRHGPRRRARSSSPWPWTASPSPATTGNPPTTATTCSAPGGSPTTATATAPVGGCPGAGSSPSRSPSHAGCGRAAVRPATLRAPALFVPRSATRRRPLSTAGDAWDRPQVAHEGREISHDHHRSPRPRRRRCSLRLLRRHRRAEDKPMSTWNGPTPTASASRICPRTPTRAERHRGSRAAATWSGRNSPPPAISSTTRTAPSATCSLHCRRSASRSTWTRDRRRSGRAMPAAAARSSRSSSSAQGLLRDRSSSPAPDAGLQRHRRGQGQAAATLAEGIFRPTPRSPISTPPLQGPGLRVYDDTIMLRSAAAADTESEDVTSITAPAIAAGPPRRRRRIVVRPRPRSPPVRAPAAPEIHGRRSLPRLSAAR